MDERDMADMEKDSEGREWNPFDNMERGAMTSFNDKLTRHQDNLDDVHDALLDAGDRDALETESLENEILNEPETFDRLARRFLLDDDESRTA